MLTEQAIRILQERYLLPDETPDGMFLRVATHVADGDPAWTKIYYDMMRSGDFLPNSPCLANAGRPSGQLSGCFVLPVEDSIASIFNAVLQAALIHKTGGGTGFSFSKLRPEGSLVGSTGHVASGPVSFMRVFDAATGSIKQGGMRRGANMGVLSVDHPDILAFIRSKRGSNALQNFNISVAITHAFMVALEGGDEQALDTWKEIVEAAHETGDPGVLFIDRINNSSANPAPQLGPISATNPCGEQPLYDYDACTLGSINLSKFVVYDNTRIDNINWDRLSDVVYSSVRFLDDVIERNSYVLPEIESTVHSIRRIGLGVMGWADALIQLGIRYDSEPALDLAESVMSFINVHAQTASENLAKERGAYPLCSGIPVRNASRTTIAPTGTISLIAGCSSGIEPLFARGYVHGGLEGQLKGDVVYSNAYKQHMKNMHGSDEHGICNCGHIVTAHEISPEWHVRMQAAFQRYTDNAVSKTVNLPNTATVADIDNVYRMAWAKGCMGVTVYRDGSREGQVLTAYGDHGDRASNPKRARPESLSAVSIRKDSPFGHLYVTVTEKEAGSPFEVFATIGKAGSDIQAMAEAIGRLISTSLRSAVDPSKTLVEIIQQLSGIGGSASVGFGSEKTRSLPDALAQALQTYLVRTSAVERLGNICPKCGDGPLVYEEGCVLCVDCGWSQC